MKERQARRGVLVCDAAVLCMCVAFRHPSAGRELTLDEDAGDAVDILSPPNEPLGLSASEPPLEEEDGCACLEDVACRVRGESSLFMSDAALCAVFSGQEAAEERYIPPARLRLSTSRALSYAIAACRAAPLQKRALVADVVYRKRTQLLYVVEKRREGGVPGIISLPRR